MWVLSEEKGPERRRNKAINVAVGDVVVVEKAPQVDGADQSIREQVDVGVTPERTVCNTAGASSRETNRIPSCRTPGLLGQQSDGCRPAPGGTRDRIHGRLRGRGFAVEETGPSTVTE